MAESDAGAPDVAALAEGLYRSLSRLVAILRRGDASGVTTSNLTLAQLSILVTLLDRGPIRMTELAARERVRTPTTTVAIRRLERLGLVERTRDPSDLRAVLVGITAQGLAVHAESLANRRDVLSSMLTQLDESEVAILAQAAGPLAKLAAWESPDAAEPPPVKEA